MKPLNYLIVFFLSVPAYTEIPKSILGHYESSAPSSCNLTIELSQGSNDNLYKVTTDARSITGVAILKEQYMFFSGLVASESVSNKEISALMEDGILLIQNYGNSINPYTFFAECEEKYLVLEKVHTQQSLTPDSEADPF